MKALVTGGAGFIGHHLVSMLVDQGVDVVVLDKRTYAATKWDFVCDLIGSRNVIQSDVCDYEAISVFIEEVNPDIVFHLAAESHVDRSLVEPGLAMFVNAVGTQNIAEICARQKIPLLYCSTDEVYGDLFGTKYERLGAPTNAPLNPSSPYSAGKAAGEMAIRAVARSFGLKAAITRGCNAWGEGQYPEKLVPIACRMISSGKPVPLHGGGDQIRQWVHVTEFAETLIEVGQMLLKSSLQTTDVLTVNIWGPDRISVKELVEAIADIHGARKSDSWIAVTDRPGQDRSYGLDQGSNRWVLRSCPIRSILCVNEIVQLLDHYSDGDDVEIAEFCSEEV